MLIAFALGLALGYLGSIPAAGPLAMLIAASALAGQRRRTRLLAAGGAAAEGLYAFAAASGLGWALRAHPELSRGMTIAGAALVGALGLAMALGPAPAGRSGADRGASALGTGFALVALNPAFLATWLGFCALLGAHPALASAATPARAPALAAGAFVGIVGWFLTLAALVERHRERLEARRQRLGRGLGWVLVALGLAGLARAALHAAHG